MLRYMAVALGLGVLALLGAHGTGEPGVREVIRWTARTSLLLFCTALAAEGLRTRLPGWADRTQLLRSLALSHVVHAFAIGGLAVLTQGRNLLERSAPIDVLGGALGYVFILWGALRPNSRLTSVGLVWIWGVFMVGYGPRALRAPLPFGFAVGLLVVAILIRAAGFLAGLRSPGRVSSARLPSLGS